MYHNIAAKIVFDWYDLPDYSHGFLVPLFSLFLVWDKRKALAAIPIRQTWQGLPLIVFSLIILVAGVYGVELFTSAALLA